MDMKNSNTINKWETIKDKIIKGFVFLITILLMVFTYLWGLNMISGGKLNYYWNKMVSSGKTDNKYIGMGYELFDFIQGKTFRFVNKSVIVRIMEDRGFKQEHIDMVKNDPMFKIQVVKMYNSSVWWIYSPLIKKLTISKMDWNQQQVESMDWDNDEEVYQYLKVESSTITHELIHYLMFSNKEMGNNNKVLVSKLLTENWNYVNYLYSLDNVPNKNILTQEEIEELRNNTTLTVSKNVFWMELYWKGKSMETLIKIKEGKQSFLMDWLEQEFVTYTFMHWYDNYKEQLKYDYQKVMCDKLFVSEKCE